MSIACCAAQLPIPARYDGYSVGNPSAPVVIEMHGDILCPDARAGWQVLRKLVKEKYHDHVKFTFHSFPLPYHRNSYVISQMLTICGSGAISKCCPIQFLDLLFKDDVLESFWNKPTESLSHLQVVAKASSFLASELEIKEDEMKNAVARGVGDAETRISFKFGCIRGVGASPWFFINGMPSYGASEWTEKQWSEQIDALIKGQDGTLKITA